MTRTAPIYVGTSGWYYDHWEGVLYPKGLPKTRRFEVYAQRYNAVEINATYYHLPQAKTVENWRAHAPQGFVYVVKAHREITHRRKLREAAEALERFLAAVAGLKSKLAHILFQLPPSLQKDIGRLEDFLALLPSRRRYAFEFRHASWECAETFEALERARVSHVVVGRKDYPFAEVHTGGKAYYRLHGPGRWCASSYTEAWLAELAGKLAELAGRGITSFTFFNNDIDGHAVRNADSLNRYVQEKQKRAGPRAGKVPDHHR